jgi:hypothetical protein
MAGRTYHFAMSPFTHFAAFGHQSNFPGARPSSKDFGLSGFEMWVCDESS